MAVNVYRRTAQDTLSLQELSLYHQIMDYRADLGLGAIPLGRGLTATAGRHVLDIRENIWAEDMRLPAGANLHSWSDAPYFEDHRDPEAMWEAPARLGTGYRDSGYEIAAAGQASTAAALAGWKASPGHNAVLANLGIWSRVDFDSIGIGVDTRPGAGPYEGRVFCAWFGETAEGAPQILGTSTANSITGTAFGDRIDAAYGNDRVRGGTGADLLDGGAGNDILEGESGADRLWGEGGDDSLTGGSGADRLAGGRGCDRLTGGTTGDVFIFGSTDAAGIGSQRDVVVDFVRGSDRIDLGGIDANANRQGNQSFHFIAGSAYTETAGELRVRDGLVSGDVTGDGIADFSIALVGRPVIGADDFLL